MVFSGSVVWGAQASVWQVIGCASVTVLAFTVSDLGGLGFMVGSLPREHPSTLASATPSS